MIAKYVLSHQSQNFVVVLDQKGLDEGKEVEIQIFDYANKLIATLPFIAISIEGYLIFGISNGNPALLSTRLLTRKHLFIALGRKMAVLPENQNEIWHEPVGSIQGCCGIS